MSVSDVIKKTRTEADLSQREMADKLKVSQQSFQQYESGRSKPGSTFYFTWKEVFGFDLKEAADKEKDLKRQREFRALALKITPDVNEGVPMYDVPVTASALAVMRDEPAAQPAYYLQIPAFKDCTFGARVSGDSMYPEIRNGDYVICKEVKSHDSLIYGDIYLVVTHDGMETVKYLHPNEKEDWVNLVPYNKSVPTTPMPKSNIRAVYKVKGVLKGY